MSNEQVILSSQETTALYCRLAALEKRAQDLQALFNQLQAEAVLPPDEFLFIFAADTGEQNANQDLLKTRIDDDNAHAFLLGGDNTYTNPGDQTTYNADVAFADAYSNICRTFPAIGNHDLDPDPSSLTQFNKFTHLPGNRRYYSKYFPHTGVELFVLNSGRDSGGTLDEPDGNSVGSIQWQWFDQAVSQSKAKWKIVMFHHPFISAQAGASAGSQYLTEMNWDFDQYGVDLILNGHNHINAHLLFNDIDLVNVSCPVRDCRQHTSQAQPYGGGEFVYLDDRAGDRRGLPAYVKMFINQDRIRVEFWDTATDSPFHCFTITNCVQFPVDPICPDESYCSPCQV